MSATSNALKVLVTRPAQQAGRTQQAIASLGHATYVLPCLDIVPIATQSADYQHNKTLAMNLDTYAHVIVISTNAAEHFLPIVEDFWPQWPTKQIFWGMGQSTVAMLKAAQFTDVRYADAGETSEDLLSVLLPTIKPYDKILIVRGVGGRETLKSTLQTHGAQVDYLQCYQRQPPHITSQDIQALHAFAPQVVILQSGDTLVNYHRYVAAHLSCQPLLIVPSIRVQKQAQALGFSDCRVSMGASDEAICAMLNTILLT